jgi:hypothetical protein
MLFKNVINGIRLRDGFLRLYFSARRVSLKILRGMECEPLIDKQVIGQPNG